VQGDTQFRTWMASLLGRARVQLDTTSEPAFDASDLDTLRLSPESERWLSSSAHAPLRPQGNGAPTVEQRAPVSAAVPAAHPPAHSIVAPGAAADGAALLDARRLDEFRSVDDAGRSLTRELLGLFLAEAASSMADIDLALGSSNCCELARNAHALKALAGNIGATGMLAICAQLEVHAARGRLAEAREQVWRLHLVWGQTRSVMESWC